MPLFEIDFKSEMDSPLPFCHLGGVKSEPGLRPGGVQHPHPYQRK